MKDKTGERCFRKVRITAIFPENTVPDKTTVQVTPPKRAFAEEGIEKILATIADRLERSCPAWDFTLIGLSPIGNTARYVFKYSGIKTVPLSDPTAITH